MNKRSAQTQAWDELKARCERAENRLVELDKVIWDMRIEADAQYEDLKRVEAERKALQGRVNELTLLCAHKNEVIDNMARKALVNR